jgi:hypothetical protein
MCGEKQDMAHSNWKLRFSVLLELPRRAANQDVKGQQVRDGIILQNSPSFVVERQKSFLTATAAVKPWKSSTAQDKFV